MVDNLGLVHMNGRVYDEESARFLSADPNIDGELDTQGWNRYSYVHNNPLSFADPTGYWSLKSFFKNWIRPLAAIAAAVFIPGAQIFADHLLLGSVVGGAVSGGIATGSLRGAIQGGLTAGLFFGAGNISNPILWAASHAAIGCAGAVASGSSCGSGALSSAFSALTGGVRVGNDFASAIAHGLLGGAASRLGGGSFESGATNGVFGYAFNRLMHTGRGDAYSDDEPEELRELRRQSSSGLSAAEDRIWNNSRNYFSLGIPAVDRALGLGPREHAFVALRDGQSGSLRYEFRVGASGTGVNISPFQIRSGESVFMIEHTHPVPFCFGACVFSGIQRGPSPADMKWASTFPNSYHVIREAQPGGGNGFIYYGARAGN